MSTQSDITHAPAYDPNFQPHYEEAFEMNDRALYDILRDNHGGRHWRKVYIYGFLDGRPVSYHLFRDTAGRVFNVKLVEGWR